VNEVEVCTEVAPNRKEHIVLALKKASDVVGQTADTINDGSALHA
jgi:magnesium-transporting ATPase (P-type)